MIFKIGDYLESVNYPQCAEEIDPQWLEDFSFFTD